MAGDTPGARLQRLRESGAQRLDPARMAQLEALARRLDAQPEGVRALLQARMDAAIDALAAQLAQASSREAAAVPREARPARIRTQAPSLPRNTEAGGQARELASANRFRRTWASGHAQERVAAAATRMPSNAGPLNSHMLVLQSLDMMRDVPGDYLRRFLTHVETLQWLEAAQAEGAAPAARKGKRQKR